MRPTLGRLPLGHLLRVALCAMAIAGCKPSSEPMRRELATLGPIEGPDLGAPPSSARATVAVEVAPVNGRNTPPVVGEVVRAPPDAATTEADAAAVGQDDTVAEPPEVAASDDTAEAPDTALAAQDVAPEVAPLAEPRIDEPLSPELAVALARPASREAQELARTLNKSGLEKHRKRLYDEAIADYRQALAAWPGHVFSRYNLACALALLQRNDEALGALGILGHLAETSTGAADRLHAARTDSDFEPLRKDPRFRALTGATDIVVAYAKADDRDEAKRLAELLRNARWAAKAAARPWNALETLPAGTTVLFRADDAVAPRSAVEVASALGLDGVQAQPAGPLPPEAPPIVVWLGGGAAPAPEAPPGGAVPPAPETPTPTPESPEQPAPETPAPSPDVDASQWKELKDFIGARLFAGRGGERETLELKPTGFFVWTSTKAGGAHTKRTGRYQVRGATLALTFKETVETPAPGEPSPRIDVREGQSAIVAVTVPEPGVLALDGKAFRARAEP
ncbi:MAG: tetratricopeptide repeat protein [Myxococcota bacterium]